MSVEPNRSNASSNNFPTQADASDQRDRQEVPSEDQTASALLLIMIRAIIIALNSFGKSLLGEEVKENPELRIYNGEATSYINGKGLTVRCADVQATCAVSALPISYDQPDGPKAVGINIILSLLHYLGSQAWSDYDNKVEFRIYNSKGTRHVAQDMEVHSQEQERDQRRAVTSSSGANQTLIYLSERANRARTSLSHSLLNSQLMTKFGKNFSLVQVTNGKKTKAACELLFLKQFGKCICSMHIVGDHGCYWLNCVSTKHN
jgi:hypothetical protein